MHPKFRCSGKILCHTEWQEPQQRQQKIRLILVKKIQDIPVIIFYTIMQLIKAKSKQNIVWLLFVYNIDKCDNWHLS